MKTSIIYTLFLVTNAYYAISAQNAAPYTLRGSSTEIIALEDYVKVNVAQELIEGGDEDNGDELIKEDNMLECQEEYSLCDIYDNDCCSRYCKILDVSSIVGYCFT